MLGGAQSDLDGVHTPKSPHRNPISSLKGSQSTLGKDEISIEHSTNDGDHDADIGRNENDLDAVPSKNNAEPSVLSTGRQTSALPSLLNILPVGVECGKAAMVMGNLNTQSILVAKVDGASGSVIARPSRSVDLYKQVINTDFTHPNILFKKNKDYKDTPFDEEARISSSKSPGLAIKSEYDQFSHQRRPGHVKDFLTRFLPHYRVSVGPSKRPRFNSNAKVGIVNDEVSACGQGKWLGLTRYLDDDNEIIENERWKTNEYAQLPKIVDCPAISMSYYWDVPGVVPDAHSSCRKPPPSCRSNINGDIPPDWGVELRIRGGVINYGPWADRQRAGLQTVFFPSLYKDAMPAQKLEVGASRTSTDLKVIAIIEDQVTLRVPTREDSKDWKWKGQTSSSAPVDPEHKKKTHIRGKKYAENTQGPEARPFGWMDIKVLPDSTISFSMALSANAEGYRNHVDVDLKGLEMSSSVNHALFWRSQSQIISCDLSNPCGWNSLRKWRIDIDDRGVELFLLRDHIFLMTDLINDWTSGPPGDFYSFVPFEYALRLRFANFRLYLNANDSNIIDNPADVGDNTFLVIWGQELVTNVSIPFRNFRPSRRKVGFDVEARDGGFEISMPAWNTQHTFLESTDVASMQDLKVVGCYNYYTATSPILTDTLLMDVYGASPKVQLYGFLIRYLVNIVDNYFGDDMHFRTMEEYQRQLGSDAESEGHNPQHQKHPSNDLDVFLTIKADNSCAILPAHLYSASEGLELEMQCVSADLRITNYYMDLALSFSPIFVSGASNPKQIDEVPEKNSKPQAFIDGIEVLGHRLFGLPPSEPTYVCNWDFNIGDISGECSIGFIRDLVLAIQCFVLTFNDDENALPPVGRAAIYDVTFLRANVSSVLVALRVEQAALILSTNTVKVELNDWTGVLFSDRLYALIPNLNLAMIDDCLLDGQDNAQSMASKTYAFMNTTIEINKATRKVDVQHGRLLQQNYVALHDSCTHRVPWLFRSNDSGRSSKAPTTLRVPAMPLPPMPSPMPGKWQYRISRDSALVEPLSQRSVSTKSRNSSFVVSRSSLRAAIRGGPGTRAYDHRNSSQYDEIDLSTSRIPADLSSYPPLIEAPSTVVRASIIDRRADGGDEQSNTDGSRLAVSSSYKRPNFPLLALIPNVEEVPKIPDIDSSDWVMINDETLEQVGVQNPKCDTERISFMLRLNRGLQAVCKPTALMLVSQMQDQFQTDGIKSLLDNVQIDTTRDALSIDEKRKRSSGSIEMNFLAPFLCVSFVTDSNSPSKVEIGQERYDLSIHKVALTTRSLEDIPNAQTQPISNRSSFHLLIDHVDLAAREYTMDSKAGQAIVSFQLHKPMLWLFQDTKVSAEIQFTEFELASANGKVDSISSLIRQAALLSEDLAQRFSKIARQRTSRLRLLVLLLAKEGDAVPDPPFLSRASYVLRSAKNHLRSNDSWRMISRLRYIHSSLTSHVRDRIHAQCVHKWASCPKEASNTVTIFFEKWRTWDLANIRTSLLMQRVYGDLPGSSSHVDRQKMSLQISVRIEHTRVVLDPASSRNEITIDRCLLGISLNQIVQKGSLLDRNLHLKTFQAHCVKTAVRFNWSLFSLIESILGTIQSIPMSGAKEVNPEPSNHSAQAPTSLHIMLSSEMSVINIETLNLKAISIGQGLKVSMVRLRTKEDLLSGSYSLALNADAAKSEMYSHATVLTLFDLYKPRIFGSQDIGRQGASKKPWKVVASGRKVYFRVAEQPLRVAEVVDKILQDEVVHLARLFDKLSATKASPLSSGTAKAAPPKAHLALFLDSYIISAAVLPSLVYQINGAGVRSSIISGLPQQSMMKVNLDLKQHSHVLQSHANHNAKEVSTLQVPPIYGHLKLDLAPGRRTVVFRYLAEHVSLNASSVHAILDAVNQPAIFILGKDMRQNLLLIQQHIDANFGSSEQGRCDGPPSSTPFLYDAHATIAGLAIHTSTSDSPPLGQAAEMEVDLGRVHMQATNIDVQDDSIMAISELQMQLNTIKIELRRPKDLDFRSCGNFVVGFVVTGTSKINHAGKKVRAFLVESSKLDIDLYTETASAMIAILGHLQDTLKTVDLTTEVRGLQDLGRERLRREGLLPSAFHTQQGGTSISSTAEFGAMYSLVMSNIRIAWKIGESISISPLREPEDLILSICKIDLATKQDNAARLLIEGLLLQMAPASQAIGSRSLNSALLPEVVFNVAYKTAKLDRRLAFQAVGKSLDLQLTSQSILPANDLRRSIAFAIEQLQAASAYWTVAKPVAEAPKMKMMGDKKLASLLVYADFGGAVVHIQGRRVFDSHSRALTVPKGGRLPQHGRYNQFTPENSTHSSTTLRAPGVALKIEYTDASVDLPSLNAEVKVSASSNVLFPTVVPLVMEISSSIKEIIGETGNSGDQQQRRQPKLPQPKFLEDERLRTADPSAVLGNCNVNLGLRVCRQDFSLSCQPIARVAARARFEDVYITVNTVQSPKHNKFFTMAAAFTGLQMSVQHVYSRESTGSFDVDSIVVSFMNSRHVSAANGISAILKISPTKVQINTKQLQDFLLFREIWIPAEIRQRSTAPDPVTTPDPQTFIVQRYQQIAATGAFPWNATVSIAELDIQLDMGQSLGKAAFKISEFWVSSRKSSNWKQSLCLSFKSVAVDCTGRMSGMIGMQHLKGRTSIKWPLPDKSRDQTPLIQASLGLDRLQLKGGFDFQTFLVADVSTFEFLMYNVRGLDHARRDRLVGVLEGDHVQIFCTATSASQAYLLYRAMQRLIEEKQKAYEASLMDIEKFLRRKSSVNPITIRAASSQQASSKQDIGVPRSPLRLQTNVVVTLKAVNVGAFPSTVLDSQVFKMEALEASARFAVVLDQDKIHSTLGMTLGQLRIALSDVNRTMMPKSLDDVLVTDVIASATGSRGGTILKVPQLIATMQTWQGFDSTHIDYIFKSSFQGRVDVGWNYSRISYIRGMYANHVRTLAQRLGKPLPQSAVQITGLEEEESKNKGVDGEHDKITAIVNVPQSKYEYTPLQPPIIETPQLRDMGEATPPLEWIGLHRDRLPNLTHQIVIVTLLEVAKEVDDAYSKILGSS